MISDRLLLGALLVEVALLAALLLLYFAHAWVVGRRERRAAERRARGLEALLRFVHSPDAPVPELLREMSMKQQIPLLLEFARPLSGESRGRIGDLARELGIIARAEEMCRSDLWWRRLRGARILTGLGGGEEVVPELLSDPNAAVRAQAVEWAADYPTAEVMDELLEVLRDRDSMCRFTVRDALLRMRASAQGPLARFLLNAPEEDAANALDVAIGMPAPELLPAALRLARAELAPVRCRAARLLSAIGGEEAAAALAELLRDPDAGVRAAAAAGAGHLRHWPAAPTLARQLEDQNWEVRRSAAMALMELGAPGVLYLRRATAMDDPVAAGLARQALELAERSTRSGPS